MGDSLDYCPKIRWPRALICRESAIIADLVESGKVPDSWNLLHSSIAAIHGWLYWGSAALWERYEAGFMTTPMYLFDLTRFAQDFSVKRLLNDLIDMAIEWTTVKHPESIWCREGVSDDDDIDGMLSMFVIHEFAPTSPITQWMSQHLAYHLKNSTAAGKTLSKSSRWLQLCSKKHHLWTSVMEKWTMAGDGLVAPLSMKDRCQLHDHYEDTKHEVKIDVVVLTTTQLDAVRDALGSEAVIKVRSRCLPEK